jgi:hypothetical protein
MITPDPGIYANWELDYFAINAINQSSLKAIAKSPLHYLHRTENETEPTDTMKLGSLAHALLFEPETVERDFVIWPPETGMPTRRQGKLWDAFCDCHEDKTIIRQQDFDAAMRIHDAIRGNSLAQRYLTQGKAEQILVWRDKRTGLLCKARLDFLSTSIADVMVELKTAADISPWTFSNVFAKRGYDVQAAFYADGYETLTGRALYGKCVAVENTEPHDVIVYRLDEVIDTGRELYEEMMLKLSECLKVNKWPGQSPLQEVALQLPKWRNPDDDGGVGDLGLELDGAAS